MPSVMRFSCCSIFPRGTRYHPAWQERSPAVVKAPRTVSCLKREVVERAKAYEAAGVDLLLCLLDPYKIPHEKCMQTIELIGEHVIPEFEK